MVMLVYAVIAPLTSFVTAFCFLLEESVCRHQATFVDPIIPDSGGKIWMQFISACLLIAEFTSTFFPVALVTCFSPRPFLIIALYFALLQLLVFWV